uniref:Uncharacterized protein n=1 Tax=Steinernema glaseri TaxID=37863 RepID=A0A1I7Y0N3_9BILA
MRRPKSTRRSRPEGTLGVCSMLTTKRGVEYIHREEPRSKSHTNDLRYLNRDSMTKPMDQAKKVLGGSGPRSRLVGLIRKQSEVSNSDRGDTWCIRRELHVAFTAAIILAERGDVSGQLLGSAASSEATRTGAARPKKVEGDADYKTPAGLATRGCFIDDLATSRSMKNGGKAEG